MIFSRRFGGGGYIRAGAIFEQGLYSDFYSSMITVVHF